MFSSCEMYSVCLVTGVLVLGYDANYELPN